VFNNFKQSCTEWRTCGLLIARPQKRTADVCGVGIRTAKLRLTICQHRKLGGEISVMATSYQSAIFLF